MEELKLKTIAEWSGGEIVRGDPALEVSGVSIDSRTLSPGDIFFALTGERFDGHEFASEAVGRGAGAVVTEKEIALKAPVGIIRVKESRRALSDLAQHYFRQLPAKSVAITGSNGKTTTKYLTGQIVGRVMKTAVAPASYNNLIGVSLTALSAGPEDEAVIFELGMNQSGEIGRLAEICRPDIGVILNVGPAHIGLLGGIEEVARAKAELLEGMSPDGIAILNFDDPRVRVMAGAAPGKVIGFGRSDDTYVRLIGAESAASGYRGEMKVNGEGFSFQSPLPGFHNLYNLLAAVAIASVLGMTAEEIQAAIPGLSLPPGRWEELEAGGVEIINDAYNANPASMRAALGAWIGRDVNGRRILVSGDMRELGAFSDESHRRWGKAAAAAGVDYLVFVGEFAELTAAAAVEAGARPERTHTAADHRGAARILIGIMKEGDSVLFKASRAMALEKIIKLLIPEKATS